MGITVKIGGVDRTEYVDARSLSIIDELTSRVNSASFAFICNDIALSPTAGEAVLIEEGTTKLFSGRILTKEEDFLPPNLLKYQIECIDNTRDLDKKLVIESYINTLAGDIIKNIISKYTSGFTTVHVSDGPTITRIAFDYIQVSEAITKIAETCGYEWYVDHDKDIYFFLKTDYPASFQLDDDQAHYRDLIINTDISQLRNRVYVKSEKYETLDFTELFIGDGVTVTWTCKYQANALPAPSATLNGVAKTVGWDGVDDPALFYFMLNATTKVLSLGTTTPTPADGDEIVITYGADVAIIIRWDDQDSIDAVKAIESGDGIFEYCITDNNIDTKEWAIDAAKADLLQNANSVIEGNFITNRSDIKSGQIITLNSTKRNINQSFLVQRVELVRVDVVTEYAKIPYKPAATATIGYKPAADAEEGYRSVDGSEIIYYVYNVTIATKLKGLEDLLLQLLYQSSESLKRDTTAPDTPTGLALSTGMGSITQASLAWLKAAWNANIEDDFSHYELKYKKTAYSDFGLVTTTNISFIWTGLEQNIEYEVYIRAVDIYGNRSTWSAVQTQVTATDTDTPAQITGVVASALFNGVKIEWDRATEDNIACYIIERQESPDNIDWTGAWTERVRLEATMWLDLFLTYTKWYRYRVTAYTQTGTNGVTSSPSNAVQPKQAATADIENLAITASLLAAGAVTEGKIAAGAVTEGKVGTAAISEIKLAIGAVTETKLGSAAVTEGKIAAGAVTEGKIGALAVANAKIAVNAIYGDIIKTGAITAPKISTGAVEEAKLAAGAVTETKISDNAITSPKIVAGSILATKIAAGAITTEKLDALAITAEKIAAGAIESAKIATGAIIAGKIAAGVITATEIATNAITTIKISAGAVLAEKIAANAVTTDKLNALAITAGKIAADAIESTKIKANAVTANKILAGAIGTDKLAALAVVAGKIAANAIVSDKIATLQITTDKMAASAITTAKINAGAVTTDCIAALAITADLIAANSIYTNALQAGAITADKYNELRNTYVFNGDDSLDASFPFELDFEIVSEMTAINSVKLSFRISQFRAYSTAAASGGAVTSASGGGHTSSSAGAHAHTLTGSSVNTGITEAHTHTYYRPYDAVSGGTHTHTVYNHKHVGGVHTHGITYGIYEDSQSPTIHYHIDNGAGYGAASANYTTDQLDIAITGSISGTGFKRIKFDSDVRCRIRAWVMCKLDISA